MGRFIVVVKENREGMFNMFVDDRCNEMGYYYQSESYEDLTEARHHAATLKNSAIWDVSSNELLQVAEDSN